MKTTTDGRLWVPCPYDPKATGAIMGVYLRPGEDVRWHTQILPDGSIVATGYHIIPIPRTMLNDNLMDDHWISVSDRLPEDGRRVIVAGGMAFYNEGDWYTLMGGEYEGPQLIQWPVTHWMPFPNPHPDQTKATSPHAAPERD